MTFRLSQSSRENLDGVAPELVRVIERALQITKVDFGVPSLGGKRTAQQQNMLYELGKSQLDGYERKSKHQGGNAFDVFAYVNGDASWDYDDLCEVATAILAAASQEGVKLEWGGHWKAFIDAPHFEVVT